MSLRLPRRCGMPCSSTLLAAATPLPIDELGMQDGGMESDGSGRNGRVAPLDDGLDLVFALRCPFDYPGAVECLVQVLCSRPRRPCPTRRGTGRGTCDPSPASVRSRGYTRGSASEKDTHRVRAEPSPAPLHLTLAGLGSQVPRKPRLGTPSRGLRSSSFTTTLRTCRRRKRL
jgi:hypothetical protein